jgi:uncharacterized membrane protein YhaH (DUF805 family)
MPFCTKCGTEMKNEASFCTSCGNTLQGMQSSSQNNSSVSTLSKDDLYEAYGIGNSFLDSYIGCIKNYANFKGRARRKEYWRFILVNFIISFILGFLIGFINAITTKCTGGGFFPHCERSALVSVLQVLSILYSIFIFSPSLAVLIRRLHDTGKSGWWWLISLFALIPSGLAVRGKLSMDNASDNFLWLLICGGIILFAWCCEDSEPSDNAYGKNPKS